MQDALDKGLHSTGLLFVLCKAYDVINHNILDKLNASGIRGEGNLWFKSYLSDC
jgi:hypothetical protein